MRAFNSIILSQHVLASLWCGYLQGVIGYFGLSGNSLRAVFIFFSGGLFLVFWDFLGPPGSPGALVGAKWWVEVVGFGCLILSQIGLILTKLC